MKFIKNVKKYALEISKYCRIDGKIWRICKVFSFNLFIVLENIVFLRINEI